jgi:hypothetical protein
VARKLLSSVYLPKSADGVSRDVGSPTITVDGFPWPSTTVDLLRLRQVFHESHVSFGMVEIGGPLVPNAPCHSIPNDRRQKGR